MIVGSLISPPPPPAQIEGLTYTSIRALHGEEIGRSWDTGNKVLATIILTRVAGMYVYFSLGLGQS